MPSKKKPSVRAGAKTPNKNSTPPRNAAALDKARAAALAQLAGRRDEGVDAPGPDPTAAETVPPALPDNAVTLPDDAAPYAADPKPAGKGGKRKHAALAGTSGKSAKPAKEPKPKKVKAPKPPKAKKVSCLDAAAQVLAASAAPMKATDMIAAMEAKGLWKTGKGLTPEATLYAAIIREIAAKGREARFKKHDRGLFVAGKGAS